MLLRATFPERVGAPSCTARFSTTLLLGPLLPRTDICIFRLLPYGQKRRSDDPLPTSYQVHILP
jgi:hypothetical protein